MTSAGSTSPSPFSAHRLSGSEVDEVQPRAGGAGNGRKAPPLRSLLLLQMRLHVHARLRASKDDQLGHDRRMTVWAAFIFDLDQFLNRSRLATTAQRKREGARG